MINYLRSHHGNRPSSKSYISLITLSIVNANERMELTFLRSEVSKLKSMVGVSSFDSLCNFLKEETKMEGRTKEESSRESESSEEEEVTELPQAKGPVRRGPRSSVSAEVFGKWNKKGEFHAPKYEKTA